jgi:PAS domain S-box-containing protein
VSLAERLTRLSDVLVALSGSPIPTHLFQTLADLAPAAVPCDYLAVCLPTPEQTGHLVHSLGPLPTDISARVWKPEEGIPGRTMRTSQATVVADLAADGPRGPLEDILAEASLRAVLAVSVRRGIEVAGALLFASRTPAVYGPDDIQAAAVIAAGLGSALESARAYQALADERSTLAAVLGSTSDAVVMLNDDGVVLLANPAVGPMLGLLPDAMVGRSLLDVPGHEPLRQLFEQRGPRTAELALADGRTAQASVVSVVTPYGEPVGVAAVLRDITLLKHLDKMKNDFVSTVSHDLKNPISVIEGTAEVISWKATDPALLRQVQRIRDEARYMAELVTDLLDLGKIEAGLGPPKERIDVARLVADAVQKIAPSAEAKGVAMESELPRGAWVMARRRAPDAGRAEPHRQRGEVHAERRARDGLGDVPERGRGRGPSGADQRGGHRHRHSGAPSGARVRQVLPGARPRGEGRPRHRARARHREEHRRRSRWPDRRREHRGRRQRLHRRASGVPAGAAG